MKYLLIVIMFVMGLNLLAQDEVKVTSGGDVSSREEVRVYLNKALDNNNAYLRKLQASRYKKKDGMYKVCKHYVDELKKLKKNRTFMKLLTPEEKKRFEELIIWHTKKAKAWRKNT